MKTLISIVTAIFLLSSATPAIAGIGTDDIQDTWNQLSEGDKAKFAQQIAVQAAKVSEPAIPVTVEEMKPWLALVDGLGEGLVKLAKDLGLTANELVKTPVGMMAMGLIVYHVAGDQILEIFLGLLWASMTFPMLAFFYLKSVIPIVEYKKVTVSSRLFAGTREVDRPMRRKMHFDPDEEGGGADWVLLILTILNSVVTLVLLA